MSSIAAVLIVVLALLGVSASAQHTWDNSNHYYYKKPITGACVNIANR